MHVGSGSKNTLWLLLRLSLLSVALLLALGACRKQKKSSDGLASGAPLLATENNPLAFGTVGPGTSADATLTLVNGGEQPAVNIRETDLSYPFRFKDGVFPGTGGTCTDALVQSQTCTLVLTYAPILTGVHQSPLKLVYGSLTGDGETTTEITTLGGSATNGAALNISDGSTFYFGTIVIGNSSEKTFTLTNSGTLSASAIGAGDPNIAAPYQYKGGAGFPGTGGTCGATLNSGASCTFIVVFTPVGAGAATDTIRLAYNDGLQAQVATRAMSGTGQSPASLGISDGPTFDYGSQYQSLSTDKTFTVTNSGGATATSLTTAAPNLAAPFAYKGGSYPGTGSCGSSLAGGASCTLIVTFAPTTAGAASDTIRLSYHNGVSAGQSATRPITATGVGYALLSISDGGTYNFGSKYVTTSQTDKTFTVTNTYAGSATVMSGAALSAPFSYVGGLYPGGGTCAASLAGGASCTIVVRYSPTTIGAHSNTLTVSYTRPDASSTTATRAMVGTGIGNPGDLDTTWGTNGRTSTAFGAANERAYAVALQSDGKAVVAGYLFNGTNNDFAIARYTTAGVLDTSFGTNGKMTTDISNDDVAYAIGIQSDGKIIVAGQTGTAGNYNFAVVRYSSAGAVDTSFGAAGVSSVDFAGANDWAAALRVDGSDKITVVGSSLSGDGVYRFGVARLNSNGSLDTSFNTVGKAVYSPSAGNHNQAYALALQSDGKMVVGGTSFSGSYQMSAVRLTAAGSVDTTFGASGYRLIDVTAGTDTVKALQIDGSGNIVLAGVSATGSNQMTVARLTAVGALDNTFATAGVAIVDVGTGADDGAALAIDASGAIVVAGFATNTDKDFGVIRLTSSGSLDATFGSSGKVTTDYDQGNPTNHNSAFAIALQSDGKIVVAGDYDTGSNADFAVFRYWP